MAIIKNTHLALFAALLIFVGCGGATPSSKGAGQQQTTATHSVRQYAPPAVPAMVGGEQQRREYLAQNYWSNFNFRDTTTITSRVCEDAFARYLHTLAGVRREIIHESLTTLMESASADSLMFDNFITLSEKYLYDPNSPMRNEELYIPILQYIISSPKVDKWNKIRPEHQLAMALKNRVGEVASDFTVTFEGGRQAKLSKIIEGNYTLLLFNNPDCADCLRVKEYITRNEDIFSRARVVSVYTDSDLALWRRANYPKEWINGYDKGQVLIKRQLYDLKAIPTLYLLDGSGKILLKDVPIEVIAQYLEFQSN